MRLLGFVIILLIIVVGVTFAMLNSETVHFNYYVGQRDFALSVLLAIALLVGVLLGWAIMFANLLGHKAKMRRLRKRLRIAEKEIENLRHIPIKDRH